MQSRVPREIIYARKSAAGLRQNAALNVTAELRGDWGRADSYRCSFCEIEVILSHKCEAEVPRNKGPLKRGKFKAENTFLKAVSVVAK